MFVDYDSWKVGMGTKTLVDYGSWEVVMGESGAKHHKPTKALVS
jgi:hypothetical protein